MCSEDTNNIVIRLRGLPFSVKESEIRAFLHDVTVKDIRFRYGLDGKTTGEAFIVVSSKAEADRVMAHNHELIGKRFIETIPSSIEEMSWNNRKAPKPDGTLRLFGLPYSITKAELEQFFEGLEIVDNGIGILTDRYNRPTGEAFVQFASTAIAKLALAKHMERIGGRYVEIYESNLTDANQAIRRQMHINLGTIEDPKNRSQPWVNPYWSNTANAEENVPVANAQAFYAPQPSSGPDQTLLGGQPFATAVLTAAGLTYPYPTYPPLPPPSHAYQPPIPYPTPMATYASAGYPPQPTGPAPVQPSNSQLRVRMRGLPFSATEADILCFFSPIQPVGICLRYNKIGQSLGEADVTFASVEDTKKALERDRAVMGTRYVELFSSLKK